MKHLYILTGASRGMGLAMAQQLCRPDAVLLGLSRQASSVLAQHASVTGSSIEQWPADLAHPAPVAQRLEQWLQAQTGAEFASASLINNAGMIGPLAPIEHLAPDDMSTTLTVNLTAPMQLTGAFLRATARWPSERKVMNISSGLAARAQAGSTLYCASKAGLDHFSRCVALEQAQASNGARVVSVYPGVIDTDMQSDLRGSDSVMFPARARYVDLKQHEQLTSPEEAAARLLRFLNCADYGREPVVNITDQP